MAPLRRKFSPLRERIRNYAEHLLRNAEGVVDFSELATAVLSDLNLQGQMTRADVSTSLRDDPKRRFENLARGMWALRPSRQPRG